MKVFDLFSKRAARQRGEAPDVFTYTTIPEALRVQVIHIWKDAFGRNLRAYNHIHNALCREYGLFCLSEKFTNDNFQALVQFFLSVDRTERALDTIELSFQLIDSECRNGRYAFDHSPRINPDQAIEELNTRFLENAVGYAFENKILVRKDSDVLHAEVVKPTLALLRDKRFAGANQEYLKAHEHYRNGRHKECLNECLKAVESTIKTICKLKGWKHDPNSPAKKLIDACFSNGLIPNYLQSEFGALRTLLESGVPTVRNKASGHGQGSAVTEIPAYLAAYLLHISGATIVMLAEAAK